MKKEILTATLLVFSIISVLWIPCQAQVALDACAKKNNGQLRIVSDPLQCKKSEYPLTIYASAPLNPGGTLRGEHCWNYKNVTKDTSGTLRLAFFHLGSEHYLCSGIANVTDYGSFPAYGNAEVVGGELYLTLSLAGQRDGIIGNDMIKFILNPSSLKGTFTGFGVYSLDGTSDAVVELTHDGTLTKVSCP
jgi:hypothetical protein